MSSHVYSICYFDRLDLDVYFSRRFLFAFKKCFVLGAGKHGALGAQRFVGIERALRLGARLVMQ